MIANRYILLKTPRGSAVHVVGHHGARPLLESIGLDEDQIAAVNRGDRVIAEGRTVVDTVAFYERRAADLDSGTDQATEALTFSRSARTEAQTDD